MEESDILGYYQKVLNRMMFHVLMPKLRAGTCFIALQYQGFTAGREYAACSDMIPIGDSYKANNAIPDCVVTYHRNLLINI